MLTEPGIRQELRRRALIVWSTLLGSCGAILLYFLGVSAVRDAVVESAASRFGQSVGDAVPILLILPAILLFLVPTLLACSWADRLPLWPTSLA